ncbi:hypothetical protein F5B20DRAFT_573875 [Whalleya microplaca]|nr:hypothetical protein F5B20DRAFT_573875 [Whalleya microplaca]
MSRGYNGGPSEHSVYDAKPYHTYCLSDGEDDDICVWKEPALSELSDLDVSDEEPLFRNTGSNKKGSQSTTGTQHSKGKQAESSGLRSVQAPANNSKVSEEELREQDLASTIQSTRRNLTRINQFILKLEARTGKATKEGIRQTLDATVTDHNYTSSQNYDPTYKDEIEELKYLSEGALQRFYLVDRHWRRQAREARDEQTKSQGIQILSEPDVKEWLKVETRTNYLSSEETCYYTVQDLADGRSFRDWVIYLHKTCEFGNDPSDEAKLVQLAWRFLDRNLRSARPLSPTRVEDFILELENKARAGAFDDVLKNPRKQELDDEQAWKAIRRYWSSISSYR